MKIHRACLLVFLVALAMMFVGCGSQNEEMVAPIHIEMPTGDLQHEIGVSGFILGTFLMLNGYIVIILSCIILLVKEGTFARILGAIRMVGPMFNPPGGQQPEQPKPDMIAAYLNLLTDAPTRVKVGYVGLLAGLVIAYVGAWIAL